MEQRNGKTICVSSCKGGVGKTITILNLAGIYHNLGKNVLIMDMDISSGAIALSLNVNPQNDIYQLVDDLKDNNYESFNDYIVPYNEHIDVLSCPINIKKIFKLDTDYLNNILTYAKAKYDVILIDTTHSINELNLILFDICDLVAFIFTNDLYDLKNVKNMVGLFKEAGNDNYKIILNESSEISRHYFTNYDIKKIIGTNIDYIIPKTFYLKDIDKYLLDNEIVVLNKDILKRYKNEYEKLVMIAKGLIKKEGDKND